MLWDEGRRKKNFSSFRFGRDANVRGGSPQRRGKKGVQEDEEDEGPKDADTLAEEEADRKRLQDIRAKREADKVRKIV